MWKRYSDSQAAAHVLPLAVFMLLNSLPGLIRIDNAMLPWWRHAPEHWVYPLQTLLTGGVLCYYWRLYEFRPYKGFGLAGLLGIIGIGLWILPAVVCQQIANAQEVVPDWWKWLGIAAREDGFDPTIFQSKAGEIHTLAWRFFRLVVVVPLIEEIFWRGFLMRYVQAGERDFTRVPFGRHDWKAFAVTTVCVVLVHQSVDWLGAFFFGVLMYVLAVRTKSLAACVWMHAVANLLLGIYVLVSRNWGFW